MKLSLFKKLSISTISVVFVSTSILANGPAFSQTKASATVSQAQLVEKLRTIELSKRTIAVEAAQIKSFDQLSQMLTINSPLDQLSDESRQQFIDSLVFTEKGLASFDKNGLEKELRPLQIYKILSLFGFQHLTGMLTGAKSETTSDVLIKSNDFNINGHTDSFTDYMDFACVSRATCEFKTGSICTSNC